MGIKPKHLIRIEQSENSMEGMRQMQSGIVDRERMMQRRAIMEKLQTRIQEVEDRILEEIFEILNEDQHAVAKYLLDRHAVMMGS